MANSHTRRDAVRINDNIWNYSFTSKWKILLLEAHATNSFLPMSWGKFITNLRNTYISDLNLYYFVAIEIFCDCYFINDSSLLSTGKSWKINLWTLFIFDCIFQLCPCLHLPYQRLLSFNSCSEWDNTIRFNFSAGKSTLIGFILSYLSFKFIEHI